MMLLMTMMLIVTTTMMMMIMMMMIVMTMRRGGKLRLLVAFSCGWRARGGGEGVMTFCVSRCTMARLGRGKS